jgi:hypothetical protein
VLPGETEETGGNLPWSKRCHSPAFIGEAESRFSVIEVTNTPNGEYTWCSLRARNTSRETVRIFAIVQLEDAN